MILHSFVDELKCKVKRVLFASNISYSLMFESNVNYVNSSIQQLNSFDTGEMIWFQILKNQD